MIGYDWLRVYVIIAVIIDIIDAWSVGIWAIIGGFGLILSLWVIMYDYEDQIERWGLMAGCCLLQYIYVVSEITSDMSDVISGGV